MLGKDTGTKPEDSRDESLLRNCLFACVLVYMKTSSMLAWTDSQTATLNKSVELGSWCKSLHFCVQKDCLEVVYQLGGVARVVM